MLILVSVYSVLSVYSVVHACEITMGYTDGTERTGNKEAKNKRYRAWRVVGS